jgi:hypothetical protein
MKSIVCYFRMLSTGIFEIVVTAEDELRKKLRPMNGLNKKFTNFDRRSSLQISSVSDGTPISLIS